MNKITKESVEQEYAQGGLDLEALAKANGVKKATNRGERRHELKFMSKQMALHKKKKPTVNYLPGDDIADEDLAKSIDKMRAWATKYGILDRKINELIHGTK